MEKPKALIMLAAGINCDKETEYAFEMAGADAKRVHINDLIAQREKLSHYHILVIPGGFSFGDDIASGKVLANKLEYRLGEEVRRFVADKKLVLGICNGFQVMVKLGILPALDGDYRKQQTTLTFNDSSKFEDRWIYLKLQPESKCVFTKGLEEKLTYLPVRHGEGKFIPASKEVLKKLYRNGQIVFQYVDREGNLGNYPINPNGSVDSIAGICDERGLVFGLMPHPEGYITKYQHPRWTRESMSEEGDGMAVFKNSVEYAKENLV